MVQNADNYRQYVSLRAMLKFELLSYIGRTFFRRRGRVRAITPPLLLDLGVGNNFTDGWTYVDFYSWRLKFWRKPTQRGPEVQMDLRFPIDCPADACDGVYTCHTLEHLFPDEACCLLRDIYRILKPGSYLRLIVPDIEIAVNIYLGKNKDFTFKTGCEAISSFTQNWGHRSAWDMTLLSHILKEIGYRDIMKMEFGKEGRDRRLIKERESRRSESLVIEARKPC